MSEPLERIQTRTKNADQHPGLVVSKRKRRTRVEMDEYREKEKQEAEAHRRAHEVKLRKIARLEDNLALKDLQAQEGTASTRPRIPREKKRPVNNIEDNDEYIKDISSGEGTDDVYEPNNTTESFTSEEEEAEPIKKKRTHKSEARDSIKVYRQQPASVSGE
jgi:capsule polysaccharide export protein KpsE/RkpR